MSESTNSPEVAQPKIAYSTLKETHRRNREEVQEKFFNRKKLLPENRGLVSDVSKDLTRKEMEGDVDSLTGLLNRNGFNKRKDELVARLKREKKPGVVLVFDLDGLKAENDTNGHKAGDNYIKAAAAQLSKNQRSGDLIGRTGGDEFVAILANVNRQGMEAWIERQNILFTEQGVRVSGGAASADLHNIDSSISLADQAMYAAKLNKANERNNFMIARIDNNKTVSFEDFAAGTKKKTA